PNPASACAATYKSILLSPSHSYQLPLTDHAHFRRSSADRSPNRRLRAVSLPHPRASPRAGTASRSSLPRVPHRPSPPRPRSTPWAFRPLPHNAVPLPSPDPSAIAANRRQLVLPTNPDTSLSSVGTTPARSRSPLHHACPAPTRRCWR